MISLSTKPFEKEVIADYKADHFCNVAPGDVVGNGRYSIIAKLGWGRTSTVWLAKDGRRSDGRPQHYVSIKFNNCDVDQESISDERRLMERLSTADPHHPGYQIVRRATDSFDFVTKKGTHLCLVHEPLRETLEIFRRRFPEGRLPIPLLRAYIKILLVGMDYLHDTCHIIHTDLKLDNILIAFEDELVLSEQAERLQQTDLPFKQGPVRRVYQSQNNFGSMKSFIAIPVIADFGSAVMDDFEATPIQPDGYRAPEVLLGWGWSSSVDIWNLGNLVWRLASGVDLFTSLHSSNGKYDAVQHLGQMIGAIGPPDPALITTRSTGGWKWSPPIENDNGELRESACPFYGGPFFDSSGLFLHMGTIQSLRSLDDQATFVDGPEKAGFVDFMGKMIRWDPEQRPTAGELSTHQWLASHINHEKSFAPMNIVP